MLEEKTTALIRGSPALSGNFEEGPSDPCKLRETNFRRRRRFLRRLRRAGGPRTLSRAGPASAAEPDVPLLVLAIVGFRTSIAGLILSGGLIELSGGFGRVLLADMSAMTAV